MTTHVEYRMDRQRPINSDARLHDMSKLENFMNRLTDMDSGWWPFLRLRPEMDQPIDNRLLLKMSICYGPLYGVILSLVVIPRISVLSWLTVAAGVLLNIALFTVLFFAFYKYTFAIFWNRRARRLQDSTRQGLPDAA